MTPHATFGISVHYQQDDGSSYLLRARYVTRELAEKMAARFEEAEGGQEFGVSCCVVEFGPEADALAVHMARALECGDIQVLAEEQEEEDIPF